MLSDCGFEGTTLARILNEQHERLAKESELSAAGREIVNTTIDLGQSSILQNVI